MTWSQVYWGPPMPALLTRMSILPQALTVASIADFTSPSFVVSVRSGFASPPESSIWAATAFAVSSLMSDAMTLAPSRPYRVAIALPMPEPAPVTSAVLPASLPSCAIPGLLAILFAISDPDPIGAGGIVLQAGRGVDVPERWALGAKALSHGRKAVGVLTAEPCRER